MPRHWRNAREENLALLGFFERHPIRFICFECVALWITLGWLAFMVWKVMW